MTKLNIIETAHLKALEAKSALGKLASDNSGASAAEYTLILALIAVVIIAGFQLLGENLEATLDTVNEAFK